MLILVGVPTVDAAQTNGEVVIQGTIDTTLVREKKITGIGVKIHDLNKSINGNEALVWSTISPDGTFQLNFNSTEELSYISFQVAMDGMDNRSYTALTYLYQTDALGHRYLLKANDTCQVQILRNGAPRFYNKNAAMLNLQSALYTFPSFRESIDLQIATLRKQGKIEEIWTLFEDLIQDELSVKKSILDAFKDQLEPEIYERIYLDMIGKTQYDFIVKNIVIWFIAEPSRRTVFLDHYDHFMTKLVFAPEIIAPLSIVRSAYYTDFLLLREQIEYVRKANTISYRGDSFIPIMNAIVAHFDGMVGEQLLVKSSVKLKKFFPVEMYTVKDQVLGHLSSSLYWSEMDQFFKRQHGKAFNFSLSDANGRIYHLTDFKDKVVIMDFWFTGCGHCKVLKSNMDPILDSLKANDNLLIVSVGLDKKRDAWLKSLKEGSYTHEDGLNLYTDGLGFDHPLPKYYGFISAPQLLVIDKSGTVVPVVQPRITADIIDGKKEGPAILEHPRAKGFIKVVSNLLDQK